LALIFALVSLGLFFSRSSSAQTPSGQQPAKGTATAPKPTPTPKPSPLQKIDPNNLTAEQVVETTIAIYGSRPGLALVRRNGWERGRITSILEDGRTEDGTYERRFIRGESMDKYKIRLRRRENLGTP
ncbi:MAG: hypothetical protein M3362_07045, partial [Acidobacteriota bacterium]|nr:hypothetical protein [Acidobacteriota bacterium]